MAWLFQIPVFSEPTEKRQLLLGWYALTLPEDFRFPSTNIHGAWRL
ncbi:TPA: hypothetical protein N0F65_002938 [Lagenidium giganteum]|uniref:Uncharacterized protein n=1 Tax=Lagenidium giganteum TaxID=4803 RepID=A0AAV2Z565_9STRA|nr:TPA: hypothetical protein N0F65_002938 [Lagenidium giganteum]